MFFTIFSSDFLHFNNWSYAQHLKKKKPDWNCSIVLQISYTNKAEIV